MYCIRCGRILESGSKFCIYCGAPAVESEKTLPETVSAGVPEQQRSFDRRMPKERSAVKIPEDFFSRSLDLDERAKRPPVMNVRIPEEYFQKEYLPPEEDLLIHEDIPEATVRIVREEKQAPKHGKHRKKRGRSRISKRSAKYDFIDGDTKVISKADLKADADIKIFTDVKHSKDAAIQAEEPHSEETGAADTAVVSREELKEALASIDMDESMEQTPAPQPEPIQSEQADLAGTAVVSREELKEALASIDMDESMEQTPAPQPEPVEPEQPIQPEQPDMADTAVVSREDFKQALASVDAVDTAAAVEETTEQAPAQQPEALPEDVAIANTAAISQEELRQAMDSIVSPEEEPSERPVECADEISIPEEFTAAAYTPQPPRQGHRYQTHAPYVPEVQEWHAEDSGSQSLIGWRGMLIVVFLVVLLFGTAIGIVCSVFSNGGGADDGTQKADVSFNVVEHNE